VSCRLYRQKQIANHSSLQVLPAAGLSFRDFTTYWQSVGIGIVDAAALMGTHSAIHSTVPGADPVNWSVDLYLAQVCVCAATLSLMPSSESASHSGN
jgi:hypothetical protein